MSPGLTIHGADELARELRALPAALQGEGKQIVVAAANGAATAIRSAYGAHRHTGNLQEHVVVREIAVESGAATARVSSTARHGYLVEHESRARVTTVHRKRATRYGPAGGRGGFRGRMHALKIFVARAVAARAAMRARLVDLVRRHGLTVSGDGGA